jgi:AhpD family alkylhydroperoxidase
MTTPNSRMKHPVFMLPGAYEALLALARSTQNQGVPETTLYMVELRASQINGCSVCCAMHAAEMKQAGESDERIATVAAWREAPWFSDPERAALALTEALTRLADRPDAVSDEIWDEIARHYDENGRAALIVAIASINVWNRANAATHQIAGQWKSQAA